VEAQAEQIFANIGAVLQATGKTFADVLRVGVYLTDMGDFSIMNKVYGRYFDTPFPARTAIAVSALPLGAALEIDLIAR
jgi:2-iminobutanoate/2-iminopropanoate deaminase